MLMTTSSSSKCSTLCSSLPTRSTRLTVGIAPIASMHAYLSTAAPSATAGSATAGSADLELKGYGRNDDEDEADEDDEEDDADKEDEEGRGRRGGLRPLPRRCHPSANVQNG